MTDRLAETREEMEAFAAEKGIVALLDHLGLDGLGNEVNDLLAERDELQARLAACEQELDELRYWYDAKQARLAKAEEALNCQHNHEKADEDEGGWEYVEHDGKTWNRCRSCGLLELWEGGMFVRALAAIAETGE